MNPDPQWRRALHPLRSTYGLIFLHGRSPRLPTRSPTASRAEQKTEEGTAMATSYLHSLWGNLWMAHREIKQLLTFSWRRKTPQAELVKAGSGASSGADSSSTAGQAGAEASEAAEGSEAPQEAGAPGPGYTPARIIGLILGPLLFLVTLVFFDPEGLSS